MALNNINLNAYAFNPISQLLNSAKSGYSFLEEAAANKLKQQLLQGQLQGLPIQQSLDTARANLDQQKANQLDFLSKQGYLTPTLSNVAGINHAEKMGAITPEEALEAKKAYQASLDNQIARTAQIQNPWVHVPSSVKEAALASGVPLESFASYINPNAINNSVNPISSDTRDLIKKSIEKKINPSQINTQIAYGTALKALTDSISDQDLMNNANPILKASFLAQSLNPSEAAKRNQALQPKLEQLMDQYIKIQGIHGTNLTRKDVKKLFQPQIFDTPQTYLSRIRGAISSIENEQNALTQGVNKPYSQQGKIQEIKSPNSFKNEEEAKKYYLSLSPEERKAFKDKLGD